MNILLFGGTGFVGTNIVKALQTRKNHVYIVTRSPNKYNNTSHITYLSYEHNFYKLPTIDAVINLAGESLFGYWTKKKKDRILHSRLETTERVIEIIQQ
ncbi:MAG TPA: NAD-dependent epimerase/dehydratase family protein, partial [Bacillota bacterium]|nr:NAD-dependent epimerase/dehydratase family protein [Bacillota bacterium]